MYANSCALHHRQPLGRVLSFHPMNLFFWRRQKEPATPIAEPVPRPSLKPGQFYCCKCGCPTYYGVHKPFCSAECRFNLTGTANYPADRKRRGKRADERYHFYFHAHGVTHGNRQTAISHCVRGEELQLVREAENPYDTNAIRIRRLNGDELGYVPRDNAAKLAPMMDSGQQVRAEVDWLNSPSEEFQHFGLKVRVGVLKGQGV
jgi:hypothetical protein